MDIVNLKQEEFIEKQCTNLNIILKPDPSEVGEHINKLQKKCGEIYICEKDVFNILCIFCETSFEEAQKFFTHVICDHEEGQIAELNENDSLEIRTDNGNQEEVEPTNNEKIKCENVVFPENSAFDKNKTQNSVDNILIGDNFENELETRKDSEVKNKNTEFCYKMFSSKRALQRHNVRKHPKKKTKSKTQSQVETDEKNDGAQSKEDKKSLESETDNPLKYKYCGRCLADNSTLKEHLRIHTGERPYQCQICGKQFRTAGCVRQHEKTHNDIRQFKCEKCESTFKSKITLYAHSLRHGEKKIKCNFCDQLFYTKFDKVVHERVHTGEKPFKCNFCGKCFQTSSGLSRHTKIHTGNRPHKCQYCDRSFAAKVVLNNHVVTHTGERPFVCTTCNAKFSCKKNLKSHEKIHSDYRGYVCKICGDAFKQYTTLRGHMNRHKMKVTV